MPTNENTYNSRVTSEALEAKFRQVFPSQGGAELVDDLYASGVIQPVIDFSSVAEGSVLSQNLQTAWDFATGYNTVENTTTTLINNPGFWLVDLNCVGNLNGTGGTFANVAITDGLSSKEIWRIDEFTLGLSNEISAVTSNKFVVYVRSGDSVTCRSANTEIIVSIWYRQIADANGNLVNPLGFTFS